MAKKKRKKYYGLDPDLDFFLRIKVKYIPHLANLLDIGSKFYTKPLPAGFQNWIIELFNRPERIIVSRCPYCGREIKDHPGYCDNCGEQLLISAIGPYCPVCGVKEEKDDREEEKKTELVGKTE